MTLVEFVPPTPHPLWKLCPQMGITDVIVKVNPGLTFRCAATMCRKWLTTVNLRPKKLRDTSRSVGFSQTAI